MTGPSPNRVRAFLASYWTPAGRQALRNLVGLVVCTAVSQGCSLGVLLILTHALSPTQFGAVIFALNLQVYLVTLGTFGLGAVVVRDLTQRPDAADRTVTAFVAVVGFASLLTGLVAGVTAAVVPLAWDERVMLGCLAAGNVFACLNLGPLFDAAHRQALASALMVPADVLALAVVAVLATTGTLTVSAVGAVLLGKWALTAGLHTVAYGRAVRPWSRVWDRARARELARSGRPMMWAGLLYAVPMSGSVVLVRFWNGPEAAALYGLAFQVVAVELMLLGILARVLQPHITGPHGLDRRFVTQLTFVVAAAVGTLVLVALVVGWGLFARVLPPEYRGGYAVLCALQGFVGCHAVAVVVNNYLLRFHRERFVRGEHVAAAVVYLVLAVLLGPRSSLGFALATVASGLTLVIVGAVGLWARRRAAEVA